MKKMILLILSVVVLSSGAYAKPKILDSKINTSISKFSDRIKNGGYKGNTDEFVRDVIDYTAAIIVKHPNDFIPATAHEISQGLDSKPSLMSDLIGFIGGAKGSIQGLIQSGKVPPQINLKSVNITTKRNSLGITYDTVGIWHKFIRFPKYFTGKEKSFMVKRRLLIISFLIAEGYYLDNFDKGLMKDEFITIVKLALNGNAKAIKILMFTPDSKKLENYLESISTVTLASKMILKKLEYFGYKMKADAVIKTKKPSQKNVKVNKTQVKIRNIVVAKKGKAEAIINVLSHLKGRALIIGFEELAKKESTGPSAVNGGDLGWLTKKELLKTFGDAVFGFKKGKISLKPIKNSFGYHVIYVEDIK